MDEIATKAIIIGVSIFVTLIIVTVLVFEFTQIRNLYKVTAETDITFEERLDEFDKYRDSNNYFNGLDVNNTIKKYKKDPTVDVCITEEDVENCSDDLIISTENYKKKYIVNMTEDNAKYKIVFKKAE